MEIKELAQEDQKTEMLFKRQHKISVIDNGTKIIIDSSCNQGVNKNKSLNGTILFI
jgi:hypothetical protein